MTDTPCYCGNFKAFSSCCQPFLLQEKTPETAEQLMRSRYSAFVTENQAYLLQSWAKGKHPQSISFDPATKWLGLKVIRCKNGLATDNEGWVEFVARYKIGGKAERIEELSHFIKENDKWVYVEEESRTWNDLV